MWWTHGRVALAALAISCGETAGSAAPTSDASQTDSLADVIAPTDVAGATDAAEADAPPAVTDTAGSPSDTWDDAFDAESDVAPVDVGEADIGEADVGAADVGEADVGEADVGEADVGAADVVTGDDVAVIDASAAEVSAADATVDIDTDTDTDAGPGPAATEYAVLSINLHCLKLDGTSFASNEARLGAIAALAAAEGVVALTVQEACVKDGVDGMAMLKQALEGVTGTGWTSFWKSAHVAWAGTPDEAEEGLGVLVKGVLSAPMTLRYVEQSGLERLAVGATLPAEYGEIALWSVHLDYQSTDVREAQARETAQSTLALADPNLDVLVGGDFNAIKGSPTVVAFTDAGFRDLTASESTTEIDHIFAHRAARVALVSSKTVFDGVDSPVVSDHPGMLVRLAPAPGLSVPVTRMIANVDVGWGNRVALRGDTAPLSWTTGMYAVNVGAGQWKAVSTELLLGAPIKYKWLENDSVYQLGANVLGIAGQTNTASPVF